MQINKENLKFEIGQRINYIRNQKNMSKDKFADMIGISGQHLGKVISGQNCLSVEKIVDLSLKTGYPTDYILLGKEFSFDTNIRELLIQAIEQTDNTYKKLETLNLLIK